MVKIEDLGLKCGIEIHQQLEGRKLFGPYPTKISRDNSYDFQIERYIRASAGEDGKVDIAAKQEQLKNLKIIYLGSNESAGLIETDESPPIPIDNKALYAALQTAKLLKSNVTPIIQVMRKTIADGSNVSGFQRTALVARGGQIETSEGIVRIENINIEEDSARPIDNKDKNNTNNNTKTNTNKSTNQNNYTNTKTYHLDRLGVPLVEIGTAPDIKTPEQAKETAQKIGSYLRALPNCKRGLGTIRQDVNVSIIGGVRVEIKGAQDLKLIPLLVENEARRQHALIQLRKTLNEKNITLNPLNIIDITEDLELSPSQIIKKNKQKGGSIKAIKLEGFKGLIGKELIKDYRVGTELAGRAKIKAGIGGIFHSDELPNYGITEDDIEKIKQALNIDTNMNNQEENKDAFILVAAQNSKADIALEAVHERLEEFYKGVPSEVRRARDNATTTYLRPMPGAARMYPETDIPLIYTKDQKDIELPELLEDKAKRLMKVYNLPSDLATYTAKSSKAQLFEKLAKRYESIKAAFIAETLGPTLKEISRKYKLNPDNLTNKNFADIFMYLSQDKIHKDIIIDVIIDMIKDKFNLKNYESLATEDLHKVIKEVIEQNPNAPFGALMGQCMKKLAGKASGQVISKEIKNILAHGHK